MKKISLKEIAQNLGQAWTVVDVGFVNDTAIRMARIEGTYKWHVHKHQDEMFLVLKGEITIETEKGNYILAEGEAFIVPQGMSHRSKAEKPSIALLIEPESTITTGE